MTRSLSHLASTGLVAGAMAAVPLGVGIGQNIKHPGFLSPTVQVGEAAARLRSAMIAANDTAPGPALVAQRAAATSDDDEGEQAESSSGEVKPADEGGDGSGSEADSRRFGGVEQIGPDLTRDEEEAAIEGGWGD